jgi:uncharacterized membrane-anchored protein
MFSDPRFVAIICVIFIGMGIFNLVMGRKRLLLAQARGNKEVWYRQIGILTGIEYIVLALALLLHICTTSNLLPSSMNDIFSLLYIVLLAVAACILAIMFFLTIMKNRKVRKALEESRNNTQVVEAADEESMPAEQKSAYAQKNRERRQKAAIARRKRAGRA